MRHPVHQARRWRVALSAAAVALAVGLLPTPATAVPAAGPAATGTHVVGASQADAAPRDTVGRARDTSAPSRPANKGPTGWDSYRQLDRVAELTTGVRTHQFSSFDRAGGNDDGFVGTHSCLRTTDEGCVLAERSGPGEIGSIWFTRDNGDVTATGWIRIELDGQLVLDAPVQDVVEGELGAPFVYPFVADADQSSGGVYLKVPMTYRESMRVTTQNNPLFYHVTGRSFADAGGVATFDPADTAQDVVDAAKSWGSADPKPAESGSRTTTTPFDLEPGGTARLADLRGPGEISELRLQLPQIVGPNDADGPDDPAVRRSNALLRDVYVRVSFDGRQTVQAPLGEFFGSGLTEAPVSALFYAMDAGPDGWYSSWWPMPYASGATVELVNRSDQTISSGTAEVTAHPDADVAAELRRPDSRIGYFNATHHRDETVPGEDWTFLEVTGKGRFVGVSHTMRGHIESGNIRNYLEGDERVYVDGSRSPALYGTGSEDFYEGGWYFNREEFSNPLNGLSAMPEGTNGCEFQCDSPYRLMIADAVSFHSGLTFGIEPGPVANEPAEYSSTAYWYGSSDPAARVTDAIDVGDDRSEAAHHYSGSGAAETVTARFEGDHDDEPVTQDVESATDEVAFRLDVDPRATGVTLRRTSDQSEAGQSVAVSVDGEAAGTWLQPLANPTQRWLEDDYQLPQELTRGKGSLSVTLTPTDGAPAWSAAAYRALSLGAAAPDVRDPAPVQGLTAQGTDRNATELVWDPAADDVAVHGYEVYGSTEPDFRPGPDTLVGTSTLSSFTHGGLDLNQTWHYVVRAVDGSGNTGRPSQQAQATSGSTWQVEAESLLPAVEADAPVEPQGSCCGVTWSDDRQLWFRADSAGDAVTLNLDVPETGTYDVAAAMSKAVDYGIAQVAIDGQDVGEPVDGYQAEGVGVEDRELGTVELTEGEHTLTLTAVGKNADATGYLIGVDTIDLTRREEATVGMSSAQRPPADVVAGDRSRIYDPSVGEDEDWYVNDHTFVRGDDGAWHLFGITHEEPAAPLDENFFAHATADSLTQGQYAKQPGVIHADIELGEKHVWAPYVLEHDGTYYMFYSAGLDDNHETYQLRLATSTDLTTWTKRPEPLFTDGYDARDPMVRRVGNRWVMYYTANSTPAGGNHEVAYRTSADLVHWGEKKVAFTHPRTGTFGGPTESPYVVEKDGWYYLFVCCDADYTDTRVYRSRDPLHFSHDKLVGRIDEHAAEVVQDDDGTWYVSGAGWGAGGVYLRPLRFDDGRVTVGEA